MNVLLINGSTKKDGCTFTILDVIARQLKIHGIDSVMLHLGATPVMPCLGCGKCAKSGFCFYDKDPANEGVRLAKEADGFIVGSPVYYAGPNGSLCSLLDRMFFLKQSVFAFKPAAAVVNARRGGASAAFDRLNKYFTISNMPVVSSCYWNASHGLTPDETSRDAEGIQMMHALADNMAWLLKCIDVARPTVPHPVQEEKIFTNFIR